jgi:hypothetical protein
MKDVAEFGGSCPLPRLGEAVDVVVGGSEEASAEESIF